MESDPSQHTRRVEVEIEVPRGSLVKRSAKGEIDLVSPLPCPFNYGFIPGTMGDDGEPVDAILLGPRLARGVRRSGSVLGMIRFLDGGVPDPKLIVGDRLGLFARFQLRAFFHLYRWVKTATGRRPTRFEGLVGPQAAEIAALLATSSDG